MSEGKGPGRMSHVQQFTLHTDHKSLVPSLLQKKPFFIGHLQPSPTSPGQVADQKAQAQMRPGPGAGWELARGQDQNEEAWAGDPSGIMLMN